MAIQVDPVTGFMQDDGKAAAPVVAPAAAAVAPADPMKPSTNPLTSLSGLAGLADILAGAAPAPVKQLPSAGLMHVKGVSAAGKQTAPQGINPAMYAQLATLLGGRK